MTVIFLINLRTSSNSDYDALHSIIKDFRILSDDTKTSKDENKLSDKSNNVINNEAVIKDIVPPAKEPDLVESPKPRWITTEEMMIWIDLPSVFPWRHCLYETGKTLAPLECNTVKRTFKLITL